MNNVAAVLKLLFEVHASHTIDNSSFELVVKFARSCRRITRIYSLVLI